MGSLHLNMLRLWSQALNRTALDRRRPASATSPERKGSSMICNLGFHRWGMWTKGPITNIYDPECCDMIHKSYITYIRTCLKCGMEKRKKVKT